jgi:hypothetical protein
MRIGILADIHEDVEDRSAALALLRREAVDQVVVLGDLFETGRRIGDPVALLPAALQKRDSKKEKGVRTFPVHLFLLFDLPATVPGDQPYFSNTQVMRPGFN